MEAKLQLIYQSIASKVNELIIDDWEMIYFFGEVFNTRHFYYFYYKDLSGNVRSIDFLIDNKGLDENLWINESVKICNDLKLLQNTFSEFNQKLWNTFCFELSANGDIQINFEYNLREPEMSSFYKIRWEYKTLGIIDNFKYLTDEEKKIILEDNK